jgi:uncharacterized membrane protein
MASFTVDARIRSAVNACALPFVLLAVAYFAWRTDAMAVQRYAIFRAGYDQGIFTQILFYAFRGFSASVEGDVNHLAVHFSPTLFLIAPIVIAFRSTLPLFAIGALACGLGAVPLFFVARKRMPVWLAAAASASTLFYPPLVGVATRDFHELSLAPAAIAWLLYAVDAGRGRLAIVLACLAIGIKEDLAIGIAANGAGAAWYLHRAG